MAPWTHLSHPDQKRSLIASAKVPKNGWGCKKERKPNWQQLLATATATAATSAAGTEKAIATVKATATAKAKTASWTSNMRTN